MNLPNSLTIGRIAITPLIAALPFVPSANARLWAFALFVFAGLSDWLDGYWARTRKQGTELGKMLDPLADKLLLFGTFVPMYFLARTMPYQTPFGPVGLPWWVVAIVLGREASMTWFRQFASRRGVVIAAVWAAKVKAFIQFIWQGAAYYWFWLVTYSAESEWPPETFHFTANFFGSIGALSMIVATALTLYSLYIYARDYGRVFRMPEVASTPSSSARR